MIFALTIIPLFAFFIYFFYYGENKILHRELILKIVLGVFFTFFILYILFEKYYYDDFTSLISKDKENFLNYVSSNFPSSTINSLIFFQRVFTYSASLLSILSLLHKKNRLLRDTVILYIPIIIIYNLIMFKYTYYSFTLKEISINLNSYEASVLLSLYLMLIVIWGINIKEIKKNTVSKDYAHYINIFILLIWIIVFSLPNMAISYIFGFRDYEYKKLSTVHVLILLFTFLFPIILGILYRNKKTDDKRLLLNFLTLSLFITFFDSYSLSSFNNLSNYPIHLCHTAVILLLISITFKIKSLFYFTYFVNVLGAFFAIAFPDISLFITHPSSTHFYYNHILDFVVPITAVSIGYFQKPKVKEMFLSLAAFTVYFIVVLLANIYFPTIKDHYIFGNSGKNVDYFFLNGNVLSKQISLLRIVKEKYYIFKTINGTKVKITYFYYVLVYFGFSIITFIMSAIYDYIYNLNITFKTIYNSYHSYFKSRKKTKNNKVKINEVLKMKDDIKAEVKISNFYKKYKTQDKYAVTDFNLVINPGEIFGFIGHNGAGKSTLIKALVGVHSFDEGRISICGFDLKLEPDRAKFLVGYVPDNHPLYENLSGREYIRYIANVYMVDPKKREERFDHLVNLFAIKNDIDKKIKNYSHGMKQKISVIASLIHEPKVWILDEPLTGLDPTSVLMIRKCIEEHASKGNIVFFSSHIIEVVENICKRIAVIKNGKLMLDCYVDDILKKYSSLTDVYKKYVLDN